MANDKGDSSYPVLDQPEILSREELVKVLIEKKVNIRDLDSLSKDTLVEQFYKNVVPMPQRKYRHNRRGREMTKNQNQREKLKRTHAQMTGAELLNLGIKNQAENRTGCQLLSSYTPQPARDRLKPPPQAINFDRKVIKLTGSQSAKNTLIEELDKKETSFVKKTDNSDTNRTSNPKFSLVSCKKTGVVRLGSGANVMKSESITETKSGKIVIKTFTKTVPPVNSDSQDEESEKKSTIKITKIVPLKKETQTKIRIKRPDSKAYSGMIRPSETECIQLKESSNGSQHDKSEESGEDISEPSPDLQTTSPESPSEEGVVTKKFKRVNIKWP